MTSSFFIGQLPHLSVDGIDYQEEAPHNVVIADNARYQDILAHGIRHPCGHIGTSFEHRLFVCCQRTYITPCPVDGQRRGRCVHKATSTPAPTWIFGISYPSGDKTHNGLLLER